MANVTIIERLEALLEQQNPVVHDARIVEIFEESVTVRLIGQNEVRTNVTIPGHIDKSMLARGQAVRLGVHQGQPILLAVLDNFNDDVNYSGLGYPLPQPPTVVVRARADGWYLSWAVVSGANRYRIYRNDTPDESSPDEVGYVSGTSAIVPHELPYIYFGIKSVSGLNESEVSAWVTDSSAPVAPAWVSHEYRTDGHFLRWSHALPTDVREYIIYRNTSATDTGAVEALRTTELNGLTPYAAGGDWFGVQAVDYAGNGSVIVWTTQAYDPTPSSPAHTVQKVDTNGFVVSWPLVDKALSYEVQGAADGSGSGAYLATTVTQPINTATVYSETLRKVGITHYRVRAVGYGTSYGVWSAWLTDSIAPGQPAITKIIEDNNQVTIFIPSSYSKPVGFSHFIVQRADNGSGSNLATVDSAAPYGLALIYPLSQTGQLKYYRLTAVDFADNQSTASAWMPSAYVNDEASVQDRFDTYGGSEKSSVESLYWLQMSQWDFDGAVEPNPVYGTIDAWYCSLYWLYTVQKVSAIVSGSSAVRLLGDGSTQFNQPTVKLIYDYSVPLDLTSDSRLAQDDKFLLTMKVDTLPAYHLISSWISDGTNTVFTGQVNFGAGLNFIQFKLLDYSGWQTLNLSNITSIWFELKVGTTGSSVLNLDATFDDFRIVKADPEDTDTYNDTCNVWDKSASTGSDFGVWHIYEGNRIGEPNKPFSYGQVKAVATPALWYLSHKPMGSSVVAGTVQAGVYFKGVNGKAGLAFFIKGVTPSNWSMYAVEADSSADTIKLVKWANGIRTELGSASFAFAPNQALWLGADFREFSIDNGRIKVFASLSEGNLIRAANIKISLKDTSLNAGGSVGVMSYQANVRFSNFIAGSPAHAEVADVANALDGPIIDGLSGDNRVYLAVEGGLKYSQDKTTWLEISGGGGVTDHGALTGLSDDDHGQYFNQSRGDARYSLLSHTHLSSAITDFAATVRATVLTGLSTATNAAITAADTVLSALGKLQAQINARVTGVTATSPVVSSGGMAPVISMPAATASVNGYMTTTYASKLNGIEAGATADQSAAEILAALLTVDADAAGINATTLQSAQPSVTAVANTIVKRHSSGYIFANYFNTTANDVSTGVTKVMVETGNDNYIRHGDADAIREFIGLSTTSIGNGQTARISRQEKTLTTDYTNSTTSYTTILSDTVTVVAGQTIKIKVDGDLNATATNIGTGAYIRLLVDGVTVYPLQFSYLQDPTSNAKALYVNVDDELELAGLSAGSHTIAIQGKHYQTSGTYALRCEPATYPQYMQCKMAIEVWGPITLPATTGVCMARFKKSVDSSLITTLGTPVAVTWSSADTGNTSGIVTWNGSTSFTVNKTGVYSIDANIQLNATAAGGTYSILYIYVNGTNEAQVNDRFSSTPLSGDRQITLKKVFNAGDVVIFYTNCDYNYIHQGSTANPFWCSFVYDGPVQALA